MFYVRKGAGSAVRVTVFDELTESGKEKFSGYIMRENKIVADIENDEITNIAQGAPLYIQRTKDFNGWISDRGADLERSYMRTILRHLKLPPLDISTAVKYVNAVSISDSFWIKSKNSVLCYDNVKFSNNKYFKAALRGDPDMFSLERESTPEITNIGSFNKGWKLVDGEWFLYKSGSTLQYFSELFSSALAIELGLNAVRYWMDDGFIVCKNFVKAGQCFEPAKAVVGSNIEYIANCKVMQDLGLLKPYLDLIFTDAIVRNADRHEFNYGFLTDTAGNISLAPNFDNNVSLFHTGIPNNLSRQDVLVEEFKETLDYAKTISFGYKLPYLNENVIISAYNQIDSSLISHVPLGVLIDFCMNAYKCILT